MNEAVQNRELREKIAQDYEWGFSSDIEQEFAPKGLSEETVQKELQGAGLKVTAQLTFLPYQYILIAQPTTGASALSPAGGP